jgi:hypothetical protein
VKLTPAKSVLPPCPSAPNQRNCDADSWLERRRGEILLLQFRSLDDREVLELTHWAFDWPFEGVQSGPFVHFLRRIWKRRKRARTYARDRYHGVVVELEQARIRVYPMQLPWSFGNGGGG